MSEENLQLPLSATIVPLAAAVSALRAQAAALARSCTHPKTAGTVGIRVDDWRHLHLVMARTPCKQASLRQDDLVGEAMDESKLTRDMLEMGHDESRTLARIAIERWERRHGEGSNSSFTREEDRGRLHSAGKAFVDRLMRKALARADHIRGQIPRPETAE